MNTFGNKVIAAVRDNASFKSAVSSDVELIFDLHPDINTLKSKVRFAHENGKKIFIHIDLAEGIGKDKSGISYAHQCGVDGIISTRANLIKLARDTGLSAVQRFFAVDSQSVDNITENLKSARADMIEIMPGVLPKVISLVCRRANIPVIAGGLINNMEEIRVALESGASSVSVSKEEFWGGV